MLCLAAYPKPWISGVGHRVQAEIVLVEFMDVRRVYANLRRLKADERN